MSDKKYTSINHEKAAGRVDFKGGKAVWQWTQENNDSTSILLKSLENPELELEKTQRTPIPKRRDVKADGKANHAKGGEGKQTKTSAAGAKDPKHPKAPIDAKNPWGLPKQGGGGFDPYNRS